MGRHATPRHATLLYATLLCVQAYHAKLTTYAARHTLNESEAESKLSEYVMDLTECIPDRDLDSTQLLDPTDEDGKLLQEYVGVPSVLYCNEPPPNVKPNAYYHTTGQSVTVVLARAIRANEEVTVDYGELYNRDKYAANTSIPVDGAISLLPPSSSASFMSATDKSTSARWKRAPGKRAVQLVQKKSAYTFDEARIGDHVHVHYTAYTKSSRNERGDSSSPFEEEVFPAVIVKKKEGEATFTKSGSFITVKFDSDGTDYIIDEEEFDDIVALIARSKGGTAPRQLDYGSPRAVAATDIAHVGAARTAAIAGKTPAANTSDDVLYNVSCFTTTQVVNTTDAAKLRVVNAQQHQDTTAGAAAVRSHTLSARSASVQGDADTEPDDKDLDVNDDDNDDDCPRRLGELSDGGWGQIDAVTAQAPSSSVTAGEAASAASAHVRPVEPTMPGLFAGAGAGARVSANGASAIAAVSAFTAKLDLTISVEVLKTCAPNGAITRKARGGPLEIVTDQHTPAKHRVLHGCLVLQVEPDQEILGDFKFADLAPNTKVTLLKEVAADDTQEFEKDVELLGLDPSDYNLAFDRNKGVESMADLIKEAANDAQRAASAKQESVAKYQADQTEINKTIASIANDERHPLTSFIPAFQTRKASHSEEHKKVIQEGDVRSAKLVGVQKDLKVKKRKQRCRSMEMLKSTVTHINNWNVVSCKNKKGRAESVWKSDDAKMNTTITSIASIKDHPLSSCIPNMEAEKALVRNEHAKVIQEEDARIATFEAKNNTLKKNYTAYFVDTDDDDASQGGGGKRARTT